MVSERLERYVRRTFDEAEAEEVLRRLGEWRISYDDEPPGERLMAAVLILAEGRVEGLDVGFEVAEQDWRDLLMSAGLENAVWSPVLEAKLGI